MLSFWKFDTTIKVDWAILMKFDKSQKYLFEFQKMTLEDFNVSKSLKILTDSKFWLNFGIMKLLFIEDYLLKQYGLTFVSRKTKDEIFN